MNHDHETCKECQRDPVIQELRERIAALNEEATALSQEMLHKHELWEKEKAENERLRAALSKPVSRSLSGINWIGFTDDELTVALAGRKP